MNLGARIGLELARARRAARLSQAALADRVGTTQSAIARAETGAATASPELIDRIARALGRPIKIVFGATEDTDPGRRARQALGGYRFDPWERDPSPVERRALEASGMRRGRSRRS